MYSIENIVIPHDISDQANGSNLHSLLAITRFVFNFFFLFLHHLNYIQQLPTHPNIFRFLFGMEKWRHELYLLLFHAPAYIFHIKPEDTVYFFHSRILFLLASPELSKCFSYLIDKYKLGDTLTVELFADGDFVDIQGVSKGKGFQGVVKRHGFGGVGQSTHGQHNRLRAPGSVGACSYPAKVFKGMRMAGQMGNQKVTVQNLQVVKTLPEHNLLMIKGSIPGSKGSIVLIEK